MKFIDEQNKYLIIFFVKPEEICFFSVSVIFVFRKLVLTFKFNKKKYNNEIITQKYNNDVHQESLLKNSICVCSDFNLQTKQINKIDLWNNNSLFDLQG